MLQVSKKPTPIEVSLWLDVWKGAAYPRDSIRAAVMLATRAGEPNRWTHYVSQDGYGFRSRMFARSDYNVMREVAYIRRSEVSPGLIRFGMKTRATMADDTAPRQFCDWVTS